MYQEHAFDACDDFSDFVESISCETSKACQVRGSNPCWGGDTLVIDTVGLGFGDGRNNRAWLDADGHPRTNKLHVIERLTRPELGILVDEITIDDPGAYSKPWKVREVSQLAPAWEIQENICNENQDDNGQNLDAQHLINLPHGIGKEK